MKFISLNIQNFGSIEGLKLPLADQGLCLILGRNEDAPLADSNGAGKSLALDAFTWALWGKTVRGISTDEVVHNKVGKNCKVQVFLKENNDLYEIRRYRKNKEDKTYKTNDLLLFCNDKDISSHSVSETEKDIESLVGLDFSTFCAMMPGAGVNVAAMTDAEIKALLERLLRTETLSKAAEEARGRHKLASNKLSNSVVSLNDLSYAVEELEIRISNLKEKEQSYSEEIESKLSELEDKISTIEGKIVEQTKKASLKDSAEKQKESKLTEIRNLQDSIKEYEDGLEKTIDFYNKKISDFLSTITYKKGYYSTLKESVSKLSSSGSEETTCYTCRQPVSLSHIDSLENEIKEYNKEINTLEDSLATTRESFKGDKKDFIVSISNEKKILAVQEELLADLESTIQEADKSEDVISSLKEQKDIHQENKEAILNSKNPYTSIIDEEVLLLTDKIKQKDSLVEKITKLKEESEILNFWVESFSPSGIRSFMLEHITPVLNRYAEVYSNLLTSGEMKIVFNTKEKLKSGKVVEKFNITVSQKSGGSSYKSNSSGERARANLIVALSLGELASLRAEKSISFRFLDEPFESIDEAGIEAIVELLNKHKDKYNTVYVITHQDSLKQMFQNKLTMVKKDGFTNMEIENA